MNRRHELSTRKPTVLIVHNKSITRHEVSAEFDDINVNLLISTDTGSAWRSFRQHHPDVVVVPDVLSGNSIERLISRIRSSSLVPILVFSHGSDPENVSQVIRAGADKFLIIENQRQIATHVEAVVETQGSDSLVRRAIIGKGASMRRLKDKAVSIKNLRVPVLIYGERGTGRDHVAECIARYSRSSCRTDLVKIDAREARPPTPSDNYRTIYLNEIHDFPISERRAWHRLADRLEEEDEGVPHRIIVSTSKNPELFCDAEPSDKDARLERRSRLFQFRIDLPPLRDRKEDIPALAQHLAASAAIEIGQRVRGITAPALRELRTRSAWPGNVKQLKEMMEQLVAFSRAGEIRKREVEKVMAEMPMGVEGMRRLAEAEKGDELAETLCATGGNLAEAARRLGMSRGAIIYRAQKFGLLPNRRPLR